ncbi:MAG: hypothetical protein IJ192_13310 [Clostridia bacterium]|nr:hypothetical protein [Clostridia bacterium]
MKKKLQKLGRAFEGCKKLSNVTIDDGLKKISMLSGIELLNFLVRIRSCKKVS